MPLSHFPVRLAHSGWISADQWQLNTHRDQRALEIRKQGLGAAHGPWVVGRSRQNAGEHASRFADPLAPVCICRRFRASVGAAPGIELQDRKRINACEDAEFVAVVRATSPRVGRAYVPPVVSCSPSLYGCGEHDQ